MSISVQLAGAVLILGAFVLAQAGRMPFGSAGHLWLNFVGSSLLVIDAVAGGQWGFLLLEGAWGLYALLGLVSWARGRPVTGQEVA
ncbi:hypothetical protein DY218_30275 [Streptomyces triticagri]|uniref:CBU-0592-like domain-containing protein n=1 Tax=Streptomyces triticagri TaxID=2293568 RepID=A0A372LY47_9ACTN|nr:hypothetical protein [Streptomyces triticagri]RFU82967.1 hypothetical protein DY218_30275 [Streptomyces triticagri]